MNAETYEKLGRVQRSLNAPKNLFNKFGGYAYRSAEGILEAVKPLLSQENAVITLTDESLSQQLSGSIPKQGNSDLLCGRLLSEVSSQFNKSLHRLSDSFGCRFGATL